MICEKSKADVDPWVFSGITNFKIKEGSKVSKLQQDGFSVTEPPMDQKTSNFACEELLGGTFDFCSS